MADSERKQQTSQNQQEISQIERYVGTLVGESTSREFRLAVAHEEIREQDIIAVDAELRKPGDQLSTEQIRVWAKVQRIERLNPLFPSEAGHELAATRTNPFDTVLSLSREMVTAVCQVLGVEPIGGSEKGKLDQLRYPPQPASSAYRPNSDDIQRIVIGELQQEKKQNRALDVAWLANRKDEVDVKVDGDAIVTRHLAILAMTGAGKSWTAKRIIEQLSNKNYPIVIFDPHGEYTELASIEGLRVSRYYAEFPVFEEPAEKVMAIVESLTWKFSDTQRSEFENIFDGAKNFFESSKTDIKTRTLWLSEYLGNEKIEEYGLKPNLFFLADYTEALVKAGKAEDTEVFEKMKEWTGVNNKFDKQTANWLKGMMPRLRSAAKSLLRMKDISKKISSGAIPLPTDRLKLVEYGGISVVSLAGYTGDLQATIYSLIAEDLFDARVRSELKLPVLLLLEEAHNFTPARANTPSEERSIAITKQIAQEGRKFGVGLILISQRPSRLDETTLSQCNSFIIMRMVNPADQNFVRKVIESLGEDEAKLLPDLDKGEAILSASHFCSEYKCLS